MFVSIRDLPEPIRNGIKSLGYNREDIELQPSYTYTNQSTYGGKGSRAFTAAVNMETGETERFMGSWGGANMFSPDNAVDLDDEVRPLPPGFLIIQGSSGYKGMFACAYVHPSCMAPLLPKGRLDTLTEQEKLVLVALKTLNSRGRKAYFERINLSKDTIEATLNSLQEKGLCKRSANGATKITTEGRNAYDAL